MILESQLMRIDCYIAAQELITWEAIEDELFLHSWPYLLFPLPIVGKHQLGPWKKVELSGLCWGPTILTFPEMKKTNIQPFYMGTNDNLKYNYTEGQFGETMECIEIYYRT